MAPLCIQHHNVLVSVVHNALFQDHPGVLQSKVVHLPTVLVHGTFTIWIFISVSLLILTFLSHIAVIASAAFQAGVAAAAREKVKDSCYNVNSVKDSCYNVNSQGGDLFPLVCETFGAWSPFALSTLCSVADYTTIKNGLPPKLAKCQLLQCLSVALWYYYSRMILRHYALLFREWLKLWVGGKVGFVSKNYLVVSD